EVAPAAGDAAHFEDIVAVGAVEGGRSLDDDCHVIAITAQVGEERPLATAQEIVTQQRSLSEYSPRRHGVDADAGDQGSRDGIVAVVGDDDELVAGVDRDAAERRDVQGNSRAGGGERDVASHVELVEVARVAVGDLLVEGRAGSEIDAPGAEGAGTIAG